MNLVQALRSVGLSDGIPVAFIAADVLEKLEEAFAPVRDRYDTGKIYNPTSEDRPDHEYDIFIAMLSAAVADLQSGRERLLHLQSMLSHRKCHDCGHVDYYLLDELSNCSCCKCKSADNRLIKEKTHDPN